MISIKQDGENVNFRLKNDADRNKSVKKLKQQDPKYVEKCLPIGVKAFSDDYNGRGRFRKPELGISNFEAFKIMAQTGQSDKDRDSILKIICVILSSYIIQSLLDAENIAKDFKLDHKDLRAMNIAVSHSENGFCYLEKICASMIVSTAVDDNDWSKLSVPTVISPKSGQAIRDLAYLRVRKYKEYKWPAPYRERSKPALNLYNLHVRCLRNCCEPY